MISSMKEHVLGKICVIFIANTEQAIMFKGKQLNMASAIEGLVIGMDKEYMYLSEGTNEVVSKIIPLSAIGYIHIEPKTSQTDLVEFMDFEENDNGVTH